MFQNLQVKGTSVSRRIWERPTPARVRHPSNPGCSQKSNKSPRNAFPTSEASEWHQGSHKHRAQNSCWPQQAAVPERVIAHTLMGRAVETRSLPLFPVSTLCMRTELRPQATCAAPSAAVCFWCVSTYCLLKGTWVPYFLVRHPWSPGYVSSTTLSTEVIKTELGTVLGPKLSAPDLVHDRLLQKDLLN